MILAYKYFAFFVFCNLEVVSEILKAAPSVALSESRGTIRRITANSQNPREYECNNQTSGIHGTLSEIGRKEVARPARIV